MARTPEEMLAYYQSELRRYKKKEDNCINRDNIKALNDGLDKLLKKYPRLKEKYKNKDKPKRPNPFAGADDIYVTKSKIAVTRTKKSSGKRGYTKTTKTKYYEQNDSNMRQLKAAQGDTVREGRKGTKYRRI